MTVRLWRDPATPFGKGCAWRASLEAEPGLGAISHSATGALEALLRVAVAAGYRGEREAYRIVLDARLDAL